MEPTKLIENFKTQQAQVFEEIKTLETELLQKKELYLKLQGAIEGVELLNQSEGQEEVLQTELVEDTNV